MVNLFIGNALLTIVLMAPIPRPFEVQTLMDIFTKAQ